MNESNWLKYGAILLAAVAFLAVVVIASNSGGSLEDRNWVATELTVDGTTSAPLEGTVISAIFENGNVGGIATCNTYFGSYVADGDSITFSALGSSLMFCADPEGAADQEQAYLALLGTVDTYEVDGDTLALKQGSTVVITYEESEIEGSS